MLSINGVFAVLFESFSLIRLAIALYEGWVSRIFARTIEIENEQRKMSISKIKSLLHFNIQSFTQMKKRKILLNNEEDDDDDDLIRNQNEFEVAQNEKYIHFFYKNL
jgi:hypothetical protein